MPVRNRSFVPSMPCSLYPNMAIDNSSTCFHGKKRMSAKLSASLYFFPFLTYSSFSIRYTIVSQNRNSQRLFSVYYVVNNRHSLTKLSHIEHNFMLTSRSQLLYNVVIKHKRTDIWAIEVVLFVTLPANICLG